MIFDKIENSYHLARQSFSLLRMDKELLVFPVLSSIATLIVIATFVAPVYATMGWAGIEQAIEDNSTAGWVAKAAYSFGLYFCLSFVTIFCNAGLIGAVMMRLDGKDPTVGDGLRIAGARIGPILGWSFLSATVNMLLNALENNKKTAVVGRIAAGILGVAWSVATYLAVPVLVVEGLGPWAALKRSGSLLRKTWGEQIVGNLGLSAFFGLITLVGVAMLAGIGYATGLIIPVVVLGVIFLALVAIVSQALAAVYRASVYYYATGKPLPPELDRETIVSAFVPVER